jgi:hypothetical protein
MADWPLTAIKAFGAAQLLGGAAVLEAESGAIAHDVRCTQPLRALLALELDSFTFIQRSVPRILDSGKVDEYIFAARPLDEPVSLGSVEPLHDTIFFHLRTPSSFASTLLPPRRTGVYLNSLRM